MNKSRLLCAACACLFGIQSEVQASPITITNYYLRSQAVDIADVTDDFSGTALPATATLSAATGNSSSVTNLNYTGTTDTVTFAYDFNHSMDNTVGDMTGMDLATTRNFNFSFTADTDAFYSIDGTYSITGQVGTRMIFSAFVYDFTDGIYLFRDSTESRSAVNELFVMGAVGDGDYSNINEGSITGNLIAGHNYGFNFVSQIQAVDSSGNASQVAATANGSLQLNISSVPVPAAVWLFGSGLLSLIGVARHKKSA